MSLKPGYSALKHLMKTFEGHESRNQIKTSSMRTNPREYSKSLLKNDCLSTKNFRRNSGPMYNTMVNSRSKLTGKFDETKEKLSQVIVKAINAYDKGTRDFTKISRKLNKFKKRNQR